MDRLTLRVAARHRLFVAFGLNDLKKLMSKATTFGVISAYNGEKNFPKSVKQATARDAGSEAPEDGVLEL